MVIIPAIKAGAAVVTSIIAASSGMNVYETYSISKQVGMDTCSDGAVDVDSSRFKGKTTEDIVSELTKMKRRELIKLFSACDAPSDVDSVSGEWNGILLDNRSWVMTSVTSFITNRLFGMNQKWHGKIFNKNTPGINLFHPIGISSSNEEIKKSLKSKHEFDLILAPSKLNSDQTSLTLQYRDYQNPLSLWRTMVDEIRVLRLDNEAQVLIAIGFMGWSGGVLNSSPFCLYKPN